MSTSHDTSKGRGEATVPPRTYSQEWRSYNAAQVHEKFSLLDVASGRGTQASARTLRVAGSSLLLEKLELLLKGTGEVVSPYTASATGPAADPSICA